MRIIPVHRRTAMPAYMLESIMSQGRILLFTGKGGVGKTTTAAATALHAAQRGVKTLVLSADPAHSLSDALDLPVGPEPEEVLPNLFAQEIDLFFSMKKYWGNIRELLLTVFRWQGVEEVAAEELASVPGSEEASALLWLEQHHRERRFELIVVDSAPTGETLTFLTLPQVTRWWLTHAFPFQRTAVKTIGAVIRNLTDVPVDRGYAELETLFEKLEAIREVLCDPAISSIRLVANPERMVVQETKRAFTYLQLYGFPVDAVIVNRILPPESKGTLFSAYYEAQAGYLNEIRDSFAPVPMLEIPHLGREVFGIEALSEVGKGLYRVSRPEQVLYRGTPYKVSSDGAGYEVRIAVPHAEGVPEVVQRGDELIITLGNRRTHLFLPRFLVYFRIETADVGQGELRIRFSRKPGREGQDAER